MRARHSLLAATAVSLLSMGTVLMASVQASAAAPVAAPSLPSTSVATATASVGSAAGLVVGLLTVLAVAAVSFILRTGTMRRTPARVITIPNVALRTELAYAGAFAD
jgi:hypothetical protein